MPYAMFSLRRLACSVCNQYWNFTESRCPGSRNLTNQPISHYCRAQRCFCTTSRHSLIHYFDVITSAVASQITSLTIVYPTLYQDADQSKYQSSASLAFVWGIHRGPVNSPHKWPVTRKMLPFDDVIMLQQKQSWMLNLSTETTRLHTHNHYKPCFTSAIRRQIWICFFFVKMHHNNCQIQKR